MIHYYYIISQKKLSCYKPSPGCRQRRAGSTWHVDRLSESPARSTPFPRATRRRGCSCCERSPGRGVPGLFRARARSCSGPGSDREDASAKAERNRQTAPRRSGTGQADCGTASGGPPSPDPPSPSEAGERVNPNSTGKVGRDRHTIMMDFGSIF